MTFFRSFLAVVESPITLGSVAVSRDAPFKMYNSKKRGLTPSDCLCC